MSRIVNNTPFTQHVPIILANGTKTEIHLQPRGRVDLPFQAKLAQEAVRIKGIREFTGLENEGQPKVQVVAGTSQPAKASAGVTVKVVPSKTTGTK